MQATARLKFLMMSPRKVRRVVSLIKGKTVEEALAILKFTPKAAAGPLAKTIESATANALAIEGTSRLKAEDLSIGQVNVDEGPRAKRIRFRAMGRVFRYKKRFAHLTVTVKGTPSEEAPAKKRTRSAKPSKKVEAKAEPAKKKAVKKAVKKDAGKAAEKKKTAKPKAAAGAKKATKKTAKAKPASKGKTKTADKTAAEKEDK